MNIIQTQSEIWQQFVHAHKIGKLAHAYAIISEEGAGKEEFVLEFIKLTLCENVQNDAPCNTCRNCRRVNHSTHPDIHVFEPEAGKRNITVDIIKDAQERLSYKPVEAQGKIIIIKQADEMNIPAANRFLKTLEEPPENTIIFLLITQFHKLLTTIRSRCQPIILKPIDSSVLRSTIEQNPEIEIDDETFAKLAPIAGSSPSYLNELIEEEFVAVYDLLYKHIFVDHRKSPFPAADTLSTLLKSSRDTTQEPMRKRLRSAVKLVQIWVRDEMIRQLSQSVESIDAQPDMNRKELTNLEALLHASEKLYDLDEFINRNLNLRLLTQELVNIAIILS